MTPGGKQVESLFGDGEENEAFRLRDMIQEMIGVSEFWKVGCREREDEGN